MAWALKRAVKDNAATGTTAPQRLPHPLTKRAAARLSPHPRMAANPFFAAEPLASRGNRLSQHGAA